MRVIFEYDDLSIVMYNGFQSYGDRIQRWDLSDGVVVSISVLKELEEVIDGISV